MARLNLTELQEYCMMFPIAYYAGEPLPLQAADVASSCANVVNKSIYISLYQVNQLIKKAKVIDATVIRPLIYHEVSHVLLTPRMLGRAEQHVNWNNELHDKMSYDNRLRQHLIQTHDMLNIFEDERIESIMRDTYMEVDFYKCVCDVNEWHGARTPIDIRQAFYHMIRFHELNGFDFKWHQFYNRSRQIIIKYAGLNPASTEEDCFAYGDEIFNLYYDFTIAALASPVFSKMMQAQRDIEEAMQKQAEENAKRRQYEEDGEEDDESTPLSIPQANAAADQNGNEDEPIADVDRKEEAAKSANDDNDNAVNDQKQAEETQVNSEKEQDEGINDPDQESKVDVPKGVRPDINKVREMFKEFVFDAQDENVKRMLTQKFFIKDMHGHQMGAIHKHSGKLDVKAVGRKDWKIFKQPSMFSDGSKIGKKLHLILVLDQSGSYSGNDYATNLILSSLISAEQHIKAFEFTVLKFGSGFHVCKKNERYSDSHEGTEFSEALFNRINELKRQDSANFIIFLNDGAAWNDYYSDKRNIIKRMKQVLDHDNCVCILDYDAYSTWFTSLKTAKIIVTNEYVKKLSDNVCEALGAMLAV